KLSYSRAMEKYFNTDVFFVKYEENIRDVDDSILYIPAIANIAPVAWAAGAGLHVESLDRTFLDSLGIVKNIMHNMYPGFSFSGDIHADKVVENAFKGKNVSMLFTSGLDSTTTYIRHRGEKPCLFSFKTYTPFNPPLQTLITGHIRRFSEEEGVPVSFYDSNLMIFLNERQLLEDFGRYLPQPSWWASVQHGMGLLGLCAPLTAHRGANKVYIASTANKNMMKNRGDPWGSHPDIDGNVSWADVKVVHDSIEWSRQEKIGFAVKKYIEDTGTYPLLIV